MKQLRKHLVFILNAYLFNFHEFKGENLKFEFVTLTDYDCQKTIMKYYKNSDVDVILKKGLLGKEEKEGGRNLIRFLSYQQMKKFNPEYKLDLIELKN